MACDARSESTTIKRHAPGAALVFVTARAGRGNGCAVAIPELTDGLLPEGIHDATLEDVKAAFGVGNARRAELFAKLEDHATETRALGLFKYLYVDGSFCTDKDLPEDIDVVLELHRKEDLTLVIKHAQFSRLFGRASVKSLWKLDLFVQPPPPSPRPDMVTFFTRLKPREILARRLALGTTRGILRVAL